MATPTIFLTAGTGNVGSALVPELAARGAAVRALVHDPARSEPVAAAGAEPVVGGLEDPGSYAPALAGVDAVLIVAPNSPDQVAWEREVAAAARAAGVRRTVKLSIAGADPASAVELYRLHGRCEEAVREAGEAVTAMRCAEFAQNFLLSADTLRDEGVHYGTGSGAGRVAFLDVRDVAAAAAELLTREGPQAAEHLLTGPEALTFDEAAQRLGGALGREVSYVELPADDYRGALVEAGVSEWYAGVLAGLYASYAEGVAAQVTGDVRALTGREPRTLDAFARDHAAALVGG